MKSLQLALIAATYAETSPIDVTLTASDSHVRQGEGVILTCQWSLNAEYEDYDDESFKMYWKQEVLSADGAKTPHSVAAYDGINAKTTIYFGHTLVDRVTADLDFDGRYATLNVTDLDIADDNTGIFCEIHWNKRFEQANAEINVYVDAEEVDLDELDSEIEGRAFDDNGTTIEPMETNVARCTVRGIYPMPQNVMFVVGDEEMDVPVEEDDITSNDDGTFDVEAELVLAPLGKYNDDEVSCFSIAAPDADRIENNGSDSFVLEVFYYTETVTLTIEGATEMTDDQYSVIENQRYTVSCTADGHPAPTITITNHEGQEMANPSEANGLRSASVQHISCNAENSDANFTLGDAKTDNIQLDVFYIDDVEVGEDASGEYGEQFTKQCNVNGNPEPKISWTKGDDIVIDTDGQLDLGSLQYRDAGEYTCTATNAAGSDTDAFVLGVNGPCIVNINEAKAGQSQLSDPEHEGDASLKLVCSVEGNNCQTEWTSTAENFISQGKISTVESDDGTKVENSIFFESFEKFTQPTTFTCKATNDRGEKYDEVKIDEKQPPACCQTANAAGLGTGAIVGIVIAIPAILIIIGAAVFFCRKRSADKNDIVDEGDDVTEPEKEPLQADHDGEGGNAEDDAV